MKEKQGGGVNITSEGALEPGENNNKKQKGLKETTNRE